MESTFRATWTRLLLAFVVLALSAGAFAQGGAGELTGLVTDSTGAVVSGVEIKLTNTATGEVRTTVTTPAGIYTFPSLPIVGSYTLEVASKGFKATKVQNVIVSVGTATTRDVKLEVGAATEQVTVEAGAQLVQTEDSSLSQNIDRQVWTNMPLETRSQNEFIGLLAGAEPANAAGIGTGQSGRGTDRGAAVNGTRSGSGNFLVEGFDNNDQGLGGGGSLVGQGGANTTISPDAIEEYRVIEHIPPAEYGKAGGFVTDTVLKSGTNQWHGSLFEYNRIQALAANSWFSNQAGAKDSLIRNQFGGSVGGPVVKDKTFFFFTVEAHRLRTGSPLSGITTTTDFINFVQSGAFQQFQEGTGSYNTIANTGICRQFSATAANPNGDPCPGVFSGLAITAPVFEKMLSQQKTPLCTSGQANCNSFSGVGGSAWTAGIQYPVPLFAQITLNNSQPTDQIRYTAKVDQKFGTKDQLNAAFLYDNADSNQTFGGGDNPIGPALPNHGRAMNVGVTWTHTISSTILNQAKASYVRHTGNFLGDSTVANNPSVFTFFDSLQLAFGNASNLPQTFTDNEFSYKDDLSVTKGKHNFKGGGEFRRTRNGSLAGFFKNGIVSPNGVEDLVTDATFTNAWENFYLGGLYYGSIPYASAAINPTTGTSPNFYRGYRANEVAAYIQDDWRIYPRLTLNLGLRWEYFGPPHNFQKGLDSNFYQGVPVTPATCTFNIGTPPVATVLPCNDPTDGNIFYPATNAFYARVNTGVAQQRDHDLWNKDLNNFGPRLGLAYDVFGSGKMVVRGGFGMTYDRVYNNIFENIRLNPPFFAVSVLGFLGSGTVSEANQAKLWQAPFGPNALSVFAGSAAKPSLRAMDQNLVTPYYEQMNLGIQYQLGKDFVLESNYVGTFGHKLLAVTGANTYDGRRAGQPSAQRINSLYSNISFRTNWGNSNYHAWQTTLRKRFSGGLQFNANYTFAKAMDVVSDTFTTKNASLHAYPTDSMNPKFDYGPADFNVKQRGVGSFVYDLPFAKSNRWLGGWNVSGIVSVQTGANFSVTDSCSSCDSNKDGEFNDRSSYIGSGKITNAINHHVSPASGYLNAAAFAQPGTKSLPCPASINGGLWCQGPGVGQMERNTLVGPGFFNTDIGFGKSFRITENAKLKFEGNFFNIFNHPNFLYPDFNLNDSTFGKSTATFSNQQSGGPRITQLAVRFDF
jgi:hypothetical protein